MPDRWRSRPGRMGERERDRAAAAVSDLFQAHLRQFGGGIR